MATPPAPGVADRLREQAEGCRGGGSPLYASLLTASADDVDAGGPVFDVLGDRVGEPAGNALALRFMAAVHRQVLLGAAPELDAVYPTRGGDSSDLTRAWTAFQSAVAGARDELRASMGRPCQTNEVGRSAALLGGFLLVARRTGLPLSLVEIGASAGLNLSWDAYRYEGPWGSWGDPASPVRIDVAFEGHPPELTPQSVDVIERRGCDPSPLDPSDQGDRLTLLSSVWADQPLRFERLSVALDLAASKPRLVERASAWPWIAERLGDRRPGATTIVFHSVVIQYLSEAERTAFVDAIDEAGRSATPDGPLAWLRMEPPDWRRHARHEVLLSMWPGDQNEVLARTAPHGSTVQWLAR